MALESAQTSGSRVEGEGRPPSTGLSIYPSGVPRVPAPRLDACTHSLINSHEASAQWGLSFHSVSETARLR